jgi:hypothetical protein
MTTINTKKAVHFPSNPDLLETVNAIENSERR